MPHSHRSTSPKQSNKSHKASKASKRSIHRVQGGKIQNRSSIKKKGGVNGASKAKADRAHMAKQRREASKEKLLQQRRVQGRLNVRNSDTTVVPRVVGIVSLSGQEFELEKYVRDFLVDGADRKSGAVDTSSSVTATYLKHKKEGHITFLTNTTAFRTLYAGKSSNDEDASVQSALDLCRVCDTVVFLLDGRDAENGKSVPITGMSIGDGASTTTTSTNAQQDYDHLISSRGDRILSAIKAQGLPTPITLLVNFEGEDDEDTKSMASFLSAKSVRRTVMKRKLELKKYLSRFTTTEFGEGACKVMEIDLPSTDEDGEEMVEDKNVLIVGKSRKILPDAFLNKGVDACPTRAAFIRTICTMSASAPKWVSSMPRAYILSENNAENGGFVYDKVSNELKLTGFIRGKVPFDVSSLVHIPNVGTFGVKEFIKSKSPTIQKRKGQLAGSTMDGGVSQVLAKCDVTKREPLEMFANPDALEGEQNLIGFGDDEHNYDDDEMGTKKEDEEFARPAGWNDYQSAWLDAIKDGDDDFSDGGIDHGELAAELNKKKTDVITGMDMDAEDDKHISMQERQALVEQRKRDLEEDRDFPDEVQVEEDVNARDRFARYRSLKSFRKSFWDPKENLPLTYASIYHFGSFKATQCDIMADMRDVMDATESRFNELVEKNEDGDEAMSDASDSDEDVLEGCVASGTYVTLVVEGVSPTAYSRISPHSLLTAVSLLAHENKVSVLHMGLSETSQCDELSHGDMPVKSKDVLTFRCGWRSWQARPVFSQNNLNSDKHKFERFMPTQGCFFAASVMGPVTYTPCPVLVFREGTAGGTKFVALGSMIGADADRIVVKRIVLTGYPTRVHKRHATVKYMFYDPDDVKVRLKI
jgi:pre-rRNA-processing protein TSR1